MMIVIYGVKGVVRPGERGKEQVCREKGQSWRQKRQAELWGLKRCHTGETFVRAGSRSGA